MTGPTATTRLAAAARGYLDYLCVELPGRRTGTAGNRAATDFFARTTRGFGLPVETPEFGCLDWDEAGADLTAAGVPAAVQPSPFTLGCAVQAPLAVADTVEALEAEDFSGRVLLLHGPVASEPLMPKGFPFYNPDEHRRIIAALETRPPSALVTATARNPDMAGALYPCPMFEDGDFNLPSVYTSQAEGRRLAAFAGQPVAITIRAVRRPATACNVVVRVPGTAGTGSDRVVVCAHIDAKQGTPGAIDNAAGTAVLLLLAELLAGAPPAASVELVAINGEDYYNAPGEQRFLADNAGRMEAIRLAVNLDGLGYVKGATAYSLYDCPAPVAALAETVFAARPGFVAGAPWYQGDHTMFLLHQRPALALTSEHTAELMTRYVHTVDDTPAIVDAGRLAEAALTLHALIARL